MNIDTLLETLKIIDIQPSSLSTRLTFSAYQLKTYLLKIEKLAPELDFKHKPYNGLRSFLKMINRLIAIAVEEIKLNSNLDAIVDTIELFKNLASILVDQAEKAIVEVDNCADLTVRQIKQYDVFLEDVALWWRFAKANQKLLSSYFANYMLFYIDAGLKAFMVNSNHTITALRSPTDTIASAISPQHRGSVLASLLVDGSLYYPLRVWSVLDNKLFNSITRWQVNEFNLESKTINIPRQDRWIIPIDGRPLQDQYEHDQLLGFPSSQANKVRCRLIKNMDYKCNKKLIIHISGGGFVMFKPEMNEGCYLRFWSGNLEGTTILSIDYTKLVAYPTAFQEVR